MNRILPPDGFVVRPATIADVPAFARMHAQCFDSAWDAATFEAHMQPPSGLGLLAARSVYPDAAVGFLLARTAGGEGEILAMGIVSAERGRGLAGALLAELMVIAGARATEHIHLEVAADNAAGLAAYRAAGFAVSGRRRGYYLRGDDLPVDALTMVAATGGRSDATLI